MSYYIGIDTGGTFTDCVVMDETGATVVGKAPSTPADYSQGILESVKVTAESMGMELHDLLSQSILFSHGTTTATNALITRSGAKTGLITTVGFEDTIIIMRVMGKYAGLGEQVLKRQVKSAKPPPLIPKSLIRGVHERIDYKGSEVAKLDHEGAVAAVKSLAEEGAEAIAVCLLWSHRNPSHEREIKQIIQDLYPDIYVTISSDLVPLQGEYERTATTAINTYLGPMISRYLSNLENGLRSAGFKQPPLVMQAGGGVLSAEQAARQPVSMIHSGPVAGVIGSQYLAGLLGYENVITTDMGGTSFDVGLIYGGVAEPAIESIVAQYHLMIPMVAVDSIGAGAGSIAWIEPIINRLRVGPQSAGADPGPACYGAGGALPTVTDANVVLGYLNPDYFLGGRKKLERDKAYQAIKTHVADPLGMDVMEAAAGIHDIVNAHMADLIRSATVGKGYDPRRCVLFAYGGAGPVHAYDYGREAQAIIVPASASVHSAMGALASDMVRTYHLGSPMKVPVDPAAFNSVLSELEARAIEDLGKDGFRGADIELVRYVDMRHLRQVHEVRVPCQGGTLGENDLEKLYDDFEVYYERAYGAGSSFRESGIQVISFSVEARGRIAKPTLTKRAMGSSDPSAAVKERRDVILHRRAVSLDVFDFEKLEPGNVVPGPAIIETPITTIVIDGDQKGVVDEYLNMIVSPKEA